MQEAARWLRPFAAGAGGLRPGPEWAAIWRAAALVRGAVTRGATVPDLGRAADGLIGPSWRLVLDRGERQQLRAIAAALPPASLPPDGDPELALALLARLYAGALVRSVAAASPELAPLRGAPPAAATAGQRWLAGLLAEAPRSLPPADLREDRFARWAADPAGADAPARLVLRLDDPVPTEPDAFRLAILLEVPTEPGVLLTPAQIRAEAEADAARPQAEADPLRSRGAAALAAAAMRRGLALAAAAVPALAAAGDEDAVRLSSAEAWQLLTGARPRLEADGIRLLVPSWWASAPRPRAELRLAAPAGRGMLGADQLVRFDWRVAVGEQSMSAASFERLVSRRTPLVRLRGGWAVIPPGAAAALLARWRGHGASGEVAAGEALLMALRAGAPATGAAPAAAETEALVQADARVAARLRGLAEVPSEMTEPEGFIGRLRPYQRRGLAWLATRADLGLGGVLADDMGLGKTVQVLALLARRLAGRRPGPTLVVAPTSVVANWASEAGRFLPQGTVLIHQGPARARGSALAAACAGADLVLTSYPLLARDVDALAEIAWDGAILDEAQNIKNPSSKQAQAARRLQARYRLALTGTPVENALSDLWSIFAFVQPGYLGAAEVFRRRVALPIERRDDGAARAHLRRLVGPFLLRRTKREPGVADELPPRIETLESCLLTREQAALYEAVTRDMLERIADSRGMTRRAAVLLALLRLKQVCNHPAHYAGDDRPLARGSGKLDRLEQLLDEVVAEGDRALVFTQYAAWARRLAAHLRARLGPRAPVLLLDGATAAAERARLVARFQRAPGAAVFVLSLKAGGAGLNLTAARHVFHYDRWWNPAVEQQATDRAHRIGQTRTVHVHKLLCAGTLEERIDRLIRDKQSLAAGVLGGAGEAWLTELDDGALQDLLSLRRAVLA